MQGTLDGAFYAAGKADACDGLMPMRPDLIPPRARMAYVRGYREGGRIGLDSNPYLDAARPAERASKSGF